MQNGVGQTKHCENVTSGVARQQTLVSASEQVQLHAREAHAQGGTLSPAAKAFNLQVSLFFIFILFSDTFFPRRTQLLDLMLRANIPLNAAGTMESFLRLWATQQVPSRRALGNLVSFAHLAYLENLADFLKSAVFPEFAVIIDTSPLHAEVDVLALVMVDKEFNILSVSRVLSLCVCVCACVCVVFLV
jgi:hypothetical protein